VVVHRRGVVSGHQLEDARADEDAVALLQARRPQDLLAVDEGAVGRAQVLDEHLAVLAGDLRVLAADQSSTSTMSRSDERPMTTCLVGLRGKTPPWYLPEMNFSAYIRPTSLAKLRFASNPTEDLPDFPTSGLLGRILRRLANERQVHLRGLVARVRASTSSHCAMASGVRPAL
jgi:hypothetical protein